MLINLFKYFIGNATTIAALILLSYFLIRAESKADDLSIDNRSCDRQLLQMESVTDYWKSEAKKFAQVIQYCPHNGIGGEIALALTLGDDKLEWAVRTEKMLSKINEIKEKK